MNVFHSTLSIDVEVLYEVLPPEDGFPRQLDVKRITVLTNNPVTGEPRRVNIVDALTESQVMLIEDEILEKENETN